MLITPPNFILYFWIPLYLILVFIFLKKKVSIWKFLLYSSFYFYSILALSIAFLPIYFSQVPKYFEFSSAINLVPFVNLLNDDYGMRLFSQTIWNVIFLLPAWFFIPKIWKSFDNFKKILLTWFLLSLSIETIQLLLNLFDQKYFKVFDIDDLILNIIWFLLWFWFFKNYKKILDWDFIKEEWLNTTTKKEKQAILDAYKKFWK